MVTVIFVAIVEYTSMGANFWSNNSLNKLTYYF